MRRGAIAARAHKTLTRKSVSAVYHLLIASSATPVIGQVSSAWNGTVSGGYLLAAAGAEKSLGITGGVPINTETDSVLFFAQMPNQGDATAIMCSGGGIIFGSFSPDVLSGFTDISAVNTASYQVGIPASNPGDNMNFCAAYDAVTKILKIFYSGAANPLTQQHSGVVSTPPVGIYSIDTVSAYGGVTYPAKFRNYHAISFKNAGLPATLSSALTAYIANPAAKLTF